MDYNSEKGIWRTINGHPVFLADGDDLYGSISRSGKFKKLRKKEMRLGRMEYYRVIKELSTYHSSFADAEIVAKCIDGQYDGEAFVYIFRNNGQGNYTILNRLYVGKTQNSEEYVNEKK